MILVGQYDSPYVRRVAVSLHVLGFDYTHDRRSVFADFADMAKTNPLVRIPSLMLDDGEVLIDSAAILDHLDEVVGPARALLPPGGAARRQALRVIALATGTIDKLGAAAYERMVRPAALRWPDWIERCTTQGLGGLRALAGQPWPDTAPLDQPQITTACLVRYLQLAAPDLVAPGTYPSLDRLSARCEALPAFRATNPAAYELPKAD